MLFTEEGPGWNGRTVYALQTNTEPTCTEQKKGKKYKRKTLKCPEKLHITNSWTCLMQALKRSWLGLNSFRVTNVCNFRALVDHSEQMELPTWRFLLSSSVWTLSMHSPESDRLQFDFWRCEKMRRRRHALLYKTVMVVIKACDKPEQEPTHTVKWHENTWFLCFIWSRQEVACMNLCDPLQQVYTAECFLELLRFCIQYF